jgi:hypothetical protein
LAHPVDVNKFEINSEISQTDAIAFVDYTYSLVVDILNRCAADSVPVHQKNFYKFWWCQELDDLKDKSMCSAKAWKLAGRLDLAQYFKIIINVSLLIKSVYIVSNNRKPWSLQMTCMKPCVKNLVLIFGRVGIQNLK